MNMKLIITPPILQFRFFNMRACKQFIPSLHDGVTAVYP